MLQQICANILIDTSLILLLGSSLAVLYRVLKCFCFVPLGIATTAPYITYASLTGLGVGIGWGAAIGFLFSVGLGSAIGWLLYYVLLRRKAGPLSILTASLGLYVVAANSLAVAFGDDVLSLTGDVPHSIHAVGYARVSSNQLIMIILAAITSCALWAYMRFTRTGLAMRGMADDRRLAAVAGISIRKCSGLAFVLSSVCATTAGLLAAFENEVTPYMGLKLLLYAFACVLVSGNGDLARVALSALFLASVRNGAILITPTRWQDSIVFVLVLVLTLFRHQWRLTADGKSGSMT